MFHIYLKKNGGKMFPYLDKLFTEVVELQPGRDKNEEKDFFPAFILRLSTGTGK